MQNPVPMAPGPISCCFCRSVDGQVVLDLGRQPSSELFPPASPAGPDALFPLRLWLCARCGLAQLPDRANVPEEVAGTEPAALRDQRAEAVGWLAGTGLLGDRATVSEFGSPHGGSWLPELSRHGLSDPANGATSADVVVDGCFGVMHEPDQYAALEARSARLGPGGLLVLQYHSLAAILAGRQWNAVRLGHYAYYSTPAMTEMLAGVGLTALAAHRFPLYGGTVALVAGRAGEADGSVEALCRDEQEVGVRDPALLGGLQASVEVTTTGLRQSLVAARDQGRRVLGYGAASRAVSLLSLAGIDSDLLPAVADASADKLGCRMPGTDIPIISPEDLVGRRPDTVLLFVSDLMQEVRTSLPEIEASGGRWVDAGAGREAPPRIGAGGHE